MKNEQTNNRPLVSLCLMCYNQERYIKEAFLSALEQTYFPLEIIVSDDCSSDSSWQILQQMAKEYKGDKTVRLYRNEVNLGLAKNWCRLCSLARGILIFKGDGDDLSLPNRIEKIVADYIKSGQKALLISHSYSHIDLNGKIIGHTILPISGEDMRTPQDIYEGKGFFHPGTGSAYHRIIYETFGDIKDCQAADDAVFVGRVVLLKDMGGGVNTGLVRVVQDELVKYRVGSGNTSFVTHYRKGMAKGLRYGYHTQCQMIYDLENVSGLLSEERQAFFMELFTKRKEHLERALKLYEGKNLKERLIGYLEVQNKDIFSKYHVLPLILLLPPVMADILLDSMLWMKKVLRCLF